MTESTLIVTAILIAAATGYGQPDAPQVFGSVSQQERQVLMELFAATGGERWTRHDGWGSARPVCDWYGVQCDFAAGDASRSVVAGLSLASNNLDGLLPASVSELPSLQLLDVSNNRLSGPMPEPLLERWDAHTFEFSGAGNAFSNIVARATVDYSTSGVLCAEHEDLLFRLEVDDVKRRAVFQSVRCADAASRKTHCLVREGTAGSLARFSRALKALGVASFEPEYDYQFSAATHGLYLTTTAVWGDRSQMSVETHDREGPREVWMAQQLFLGLLAEVSWERESRKSRCDFEK